MKKLQGKVAIITGAGAGIGRTTAELFGAEGANVVVSEINRDNGAETADRIVKAGGKALFIHTDVTDAASVEAMVKKTVATFGRLDILFNNAGGSTREDGWVTEISEDAFWKAVKLNFYGPWLCSRYGIPEIIKSGGGSVINVGSETATRAPTGRHAYSSAKGAVMAFTTNCAHTYAKDRVRVNALMPGLTLTDRTEGFIKQSPNIAKIEGDHPLGIGSTKSAAALALFLASDDSSHTTGQLITVNNELFGAPTK
jgi:NAD(P)-dependent dehydrogenase (short-subunit alcohol dehydrogenase family)